MTYLDYAATDSWPKYKCSDYNWHFNPNTNYAYGEKKLLKICEERIKKAIGAHGGKVIFGGTASQLIENLMSAAHNIFEQEGIEGIMLGS